MRKLLLNTTNEKLKDLKIRLKTAGNSLNIEWESNNVLLVKECDYDNLTNGLNWLGIQYSDYNDLHKEVIVNNKNTETSDLEKQIEEQIEIYQMQLQDDLKHLFWLMKGLGINTKEKLDEVLEFAVLFNKLKEEGAIRQLSNYDE